MDNLDWSGKKCGGLVREEGGKGGRYNSIFRNIAAVNTGMIGIRGRNGRFLEISPDWYSRRSWCWRRWWRIVLLNRSAGILTARSNLFSQCLSLSPSPLSLSSPARIAKFRTETSLSPLNFILSRVKFSPSPSPFFETINQIEKD